MSEPRPGTLTPGSLVLARLLPAGKNGAPCAQLQDALRTGLDRDEKGPALADLLEGLVSKGLIERTGKGTTERWRLTESGQRQALDVLGLDALPSRTSWTIIRNVYLTVRSLGLHAPTAAEVRRFGQADGFKAALLKSRFGLPIDDYPTLPQAVSALAWSMIGIASSEEFSAPNVQRALFQRALGESRPSTLARLIDRLIARSLGTEEAKVDAFRLAVLRGLPERSNAEWVPTVGAKTVDAVPEAPTTEPRAVPVEVRGFLPTDVSEPPREKETIPFALLAFAYRVLSVARSMPSGRVGDRLVLIGPLWETLRRDASFLGLGRSDFRQRLIEADQARLLDLEPVPAFEDLDPDLLRDSETLRAGGTVHAVALPR